MIYPLLISHTEVARSQYEVGGQLSPNAPSLQSNGASSSQSSCDTETISPQSDGNDNNIWHLKVPFRHEYAQGVVRISETTTSPVGVWPGSPETTMDMAPAVNPSYYSSQQLLDWQRAVPQSQTRASVVEVRPGPSGNVMQKSPAANPSQASPQQQVADWKTVMDLLRDTESQSPDNIPEMSLVPHSSHPMETTQKDVHRYPVCVACARRKVKCDRQEPCSNCTKTNRTCSYSSRPRGRQWPSEEDIHDRCQRYEELLRQHNIDFTLPGSWKNNSFSTAHNKTKRSS